MSTSQMSITDCTKAEAVDNGAAEYSAPTSILLVGTCTNNLFPPEIGVTTVSSPSATWIIPFILSAIASALSTIAKSNSLPKILDLSPPTDAVLTDFSSPSKFTATVLLTPFTMLSIAGFLNGLIASIGTSDAISLPLSSNKSILSSNFAIFSLLNK